LQIYEETLFGFPIIKKEEEEEENTLHLSPPPFLQTTIYLAHLDHRRMKILHNSRTRHKPYMKLED
jgi:hypothetical protein